MSLERDIRETLMKTANEVEPGESRFGEVESKIRRRHAATLVGTTAFALAVIVAGAIVIPQLTGGSSTRPPGFATAPPSETPPPSTDGSVYRNELDSYQTVFPRDWKVGGFEGAVEFTPPGLPGLAVGEDTFAVEIQHRIGERYDEADPSFEPGADVAGRSAVRSRADTQIVYRVDWTGAGCDPEAVCDAEIATLFVNLYGSTQRLWDRYQAEGRAIVESLRTTPGTPVETDDVIITRRGSVDGELVEYDELTAFLVRFMDARMDGGGAESYLTENAAAQYQAREGEWGLYAYGDPAIPWTRYGVIERANVDANSSEFTVRSFTTNQRDEEVILEEVIGVGAGGDGYEIRFTQQQEVHRDGP